MSAIVPARNPHTPSPELRDRALAAIDANLYVRPRYGITEAHRHAAAALLASLWSFTEAMGISRDDWRTTADLPGSCLNLAGMQIRRAGHRAEIASRAE